jgi:hypothetical protein
MNTFFNHKNIHKYEYTWSARNSKSIIDYFIANKKISKLFLDIRTYRGCEIESGHCLIQAKLRIPPKWLKTPTNIQNERKQCYQIKLLYDESIRWVFAQRVKQQIEKIPDHDAIETERENIKTIINTQPI